VAYALFPVCPVDKALDAILQTDNIEVYKQSNGFTTELEIRNDLRMVDGRNRLHGFDSTTTKSSANKSMR
jgi:hypothetical protein